MALLRNDGPKSVTSSPRHHKVRASEGRSGAVALWNFDLAATHVTRAALISAPVDSERCLGIGDRARHGIEMMDHVFVAVIADFDARAF